MQERIFVSKRNMVNFITNHLTRICHLLKQNYKVTVNECMLVIIVGNLYHVCLPLLKIGQRAMLDIGGGEGKLWSLCEKKKIVKLFKSFVMKVKHWNTTYAHPSAPLAKNGGKSDAITSGWIFTTTLWQKKKTVKLFKWPARKLKHKTLLFFYIYLHIYIYI